MKRNGVKSSNIRSVGYDGGTKVLEVEFSNGAVWQYDDVPAVVYSEMISADSVGSYFARMVRGSYTAKREDAKES